MAFVIEYTRGFFDAAYEQQIMGLYGRPVVGRRFEPIGSLRSRSIVDFVRCSYLGLDNHPAIVAGAIAAIRDYGSVHWSCARTRLNFGLLGDLEARLSAMFRARVIAFSTVMVANMGALPLIASGALTGGEKPLVAFDRLCHASLAHHKAVVAQETEIVTIAHNDVQALEELCRTRKQVAYVADGVYSMGGSAPIPALIDLQQRYGLFLYIDDAHGISLFGDKGEGYARSHFPDEIGSRTIIAASLGKGFGASGGILMMGTAEQEKLFRSHAQPYVFSAAPNLAAVGAGLASAALHDSGELSRLQSDLAARVSCFDDRIETRQRRTPLPIRMLSIGEEDAAIRAARRLLDRGFYTSATFFPTVARGKAGIRVCLTAAHSHAEIEELCQAIEDVVPGHDSALPTSATRSDAISPNRYVGDVPASLADRLSYADTEEWGA